MSIRIKHLALRGALAILLLATGWQAVPVASQAASSTAAPAVHLTIGSTSVTRGDMAIIPVTVKPETGVSSYNMQIQFDPKSIEIVRVIPQYGSTDDVGCLISEQGCFKSGYDNNAGWLRAAWIDASTGSNSEHPITAEKVLFNVEIKAKTTGNQTITIDDSSLENLSFTDAAFTGDKPRQLAVTVISGKLNVSAPSSGAGNNGGDNSPGQTPSQPSQPGVPNTAVEVLVNGKVENAGTLTTSQANGQSVTTITIDQQKLDEKLAAEGAHTTITIPVHGTSDVIVGELNGQMVQSMEQKQAVVVIQTDRASYTLPAEQINIQTIAKQLGNAVSLQDIKVRISIATPTADTLKLVNSTAAKDGFTLAAPALNFTVTGVYGAQTIDISRFNAYVERTVAIPDDVDPSKITTGVVIDPDGTVRHVPTKIVMADGKYFAQVNSLTNSTYGIIWHPLEFKDVAKHWAKTAINDMGSRMIVNGASKDSFQPNQNITRAEFAAIIVRGLGLKPENGSATFSDVQETAWYNEAVQTAYAYKLINGFEDGTFHPLDKITREQAMVMIAKAMTITELNDKLASHDTNVLLQPFTDRSNISQWARDSVSDCLQAGIVTGKNGNTLAPKANISRAEVAVIVQRLLQKSELI